MAIILGILAGIGLPIQTGINTTLRKKSGFSLPCLACVFRRCAGIFSITAHRDRRRRSYSIWKDFKGTFMDLDGRNLRSHFSDGEHSSDFKNRKCADCSSSCFGTNPDGTDCRQLWAFLCRAGKNHCSAYFRSIVCHWRRSDSFNDKRY